MKKLSQVIIEQRIFMIRGRKVMIDRDLAELYGVETKYLNRQVKRNPDRFPEEFMMQLSESEKRELVTKWHRFAPLKHASNPPYAFTEQGVAMLSSVLNNQRAIKINILIIKVFLRMRELLLSHQGLAIKLGEMERKIEKHDQEIYAIMNTLKNLILRPEKSRRIIGFHP